ncbi:zinc finger and SCAN domain-containing 9 [Labeo rohita]|uniref:Zinc finger and SCAN domain-containing 9 n=1 Tax=Labeo rohita TaxID=84645 RepID=A0A498MTL5_LABRO|nr:zinc finger and SCAN domain-containing 9 [Labeo rohita]
MATRKTAPKGRKPRTGLRSQVKASEEEAAWNSVETTEDEEGATNFPRVSQKSSPPSTKSVTPDATAGEGMISLMRRFLDNQEQREERYLQELRGLRESIVQSICPAETLLDAESVRLELPTPAPKVSTRQRPAYIQDSPNVTAPREPTHWADPKMPSFQQGEDIENYLRRFERQALEAYLAMDEERAEVYTDLKEALLEKFNISPETYRQRFRSTTVPAGESPTETYNRLKNLYKRWVRPEEHSKEEIGEAIILEQLLRVLPYDARTWVREHEPRSGLAAAKLAQQYLNAHRSGPRTQQPKELKPGQVYSLCQT